MYLPMTDRLTDTEWSVCVFDEGDPCMSNPCQYHSTCAPVNMSSYTCDCSAPFFGELCQFGDYTQQTYTQTYIYADGDCVTICIVLFDGTIHRHWLE